MAGVQAVERNVASAPDQLFARIGAFLSDQRLAPDPANYAFAYKVVATPAGPLAKAVNALVDGGVRLTQRDIDALGIDVGGAAAPTPAAGDAQGLAASTQMQVEGFEDMVRAMQAETQGFGRDLAASAEALRESGGEDADEVARLTAAMLDRVRSAESRLEAATSEASVLREKLDEARGHARRDPLTDLANRRAFEEAFALVLETGARPVVALCDIDHFKAVNDTYGHAVGDRVLKTIAQALVDSCEGHLVARYGGEEFAVLFTGGDAELARDTLDAAREAVSLRRFRLRETDKPLGSVTFSAGLTQGRDDELLSQTLRRADMLLYDAKAAGRNRLSPG